MPNYFDVIESNKFWEAQESDIFPLPIVAIALGIGRYRMCQIPVFRIMLNKRVYYKKGDILDWALTDEGKSLLNQLRDKNSSIGKEAKTRSLFYDHYYTKSNESHYRPSNGKLETKKDTYTRLHNEWRSYGRSALREGVINKLRSCDDNEELKKLITIAWSIREQFVKLRMGLPCGIALGNWWFAKDFESVLKGRAEERRAMIQRQIDFKRDVLDAMAYPMYAATLGVKVNVEKWMEKEKIEIELLKAKMKELG